MTRGLRMVFDILVVILKPFRLKDIVDCIVLKNAITAKAPKFFTTEGARERRVFLEMPAALDGCFADDYDLDSSLRSE